jgi:hypothetical protein
MFIFQTRIFWREMSIPLKLVRNTFKGYFGSEEKSINNREEAIKLLFDILNSIQEKMIARIKNENSYDMLMKLYYIFDEVHFFYLEQKRARLKLVEKNVNNESIVDIFSKNRNIARNIIDASNIWIENCILFQHDVEIMDQAGTREFKMDYELLIDLFIYGLASQGISLLSLSKKFVKQELFYGLKITPDEDLPAEVLKYHPIIFFNPVILGNQNILSESPLTKESNETDFGRGFKSEYNVEFLLFLAAIQMLQRDLLRGDMKALTVINKEYFISLLGSYTEPPVDGKAFYDSFVLTKDKLHSQLKRNENIIWMIGTNKIRHELNPIIGLDNNRVFISYAAIEQSKQLWVSYFGNGGMCYSNTKDNLTKAIEKRNKELSDILVEEIRKILQKHYEATFDEIDVKSRRIYGNREIDYGDYDLVFYSRKAKELFLIEAKFFSDSLNTSGIVTDYEKLFTEDGYYDRCKRRYDLVLSESEAMKAFVGADEIIQMHCLFLSSKPLEIEFQDKDGVVTFVSLNIFEKYITGNLINDEDDSVARPTHTI